MGDPAVLEDYGTILFGVRILSITQIYGKAPLDFMGGISVETIRGEKVNDTNLQQ